MTTTETNINLTDLIRRGGTLADCDAALTYLSRIQDRAWTTQDQDLTVCASALIEAVRAVRRAERPDEAGHANMSDGPITIPERRQGWGFRRRVHQPGVID